MLLLKLKNLPALRRGLEAFGERVRVAAGEAVREGAARIAASAKGRVAVRRPSSNFGRTSQAPSRSTAT